MTVEELLKPRYKVIADYPGNDMAVGKIIEFGWHLLNQRIELCCYYDKYHHLFRKLEWWEERNPEDMPGYVKETFYDTVFKVKDWDGSNCYNADRKATHFLMIDVNTKEINRYLTYTPATEAEYKEYIKTKTHQP